MKPLPLLASILAFAAIVQASAPGPLKTFQRAGCQIQARAYIDAAYKTPRESSRFDLLLTAPKGEPTYWEFSLPGNDYYSYTNAQSALSYVPYGNKTRTTIRATLHHFDTYDESVTFKDLRLAPITTAPKGFYFSPMRHLEIKENLTRTTPSGISITLPKQSANVLPMDFNGNAEAVFIKIHVTPEKPLNQLGQSPLFHRYGKPVRIKLEVPAPNLLVSYQADNTYPLIAVGIPHLKTATTMDLTLIVRQKVELETIPIALDVPIAHPTKP